MCDIQDITLICGAYILSVVYSFCVDSDNYSNKKLKKKLKTSLVRQQKITRAFTLFTIIKRAAQQKAHINYIEYRNVCDSRVKSKEYVLRSCFVDNKKKSFLRFLWDPKPEIENLLPIDASRSRPSIEIATHDRLQRAFEYLTKTFFFRFNVLPSILR